jgi:carbonic anhydrase
MLEPNASESLSELFARNRRWVAEVTETDKAFFTRLANQQSPEYLWIGCSDSRVPANQIIGLAPGEVFVHRNIANMVVHTDLNVLSVIQFAIEQLKVKHIIVVGHYGCSGVKAAMQNKRLGLADNWIRHVRDVQQKHEHYLGHVMDDEDRLDKLCELNVIEQVIHVSQTSAVNEAWARGQSLTVHGWIYGLHDGLVRDLGVSVDSPEHLKQRYADVMQHQYADTNEQQT